MGVVLGGGGSRTAVHIGLLAALHEENIIPDVVSGCSMGAVLGAAYARNPDVDELRKLFHDRLIKSSTFRGARQPKFIACAQNRRGILTRLGRGFLTGTMGWALSFRRGLLKRHPLYRVIDEIFEDGDQIEDLTIPFACVALNLTDGGLETFNGGSVRMALKAGVSVGWVFSPFDWEGKEYIDAAPVSPVPVSACRSLGADVVLAADVTSVVAGGEVMENGYDVLRRIVSIGGDNLNRAELSGADLVTRPDTEGIFWGDFSRWRELEEKGRQAVLPLLPELKRLLTT